MAYSLSKTIMKGLKQFIFVIIAGLTALYSNNPTFLAIAPLLTMLENYLKHKDDKDKPKPKKKTK